MLASLLSERRKLALQTLFRLAQLVPNLVAPMIPCVIKCLEDRDFHVRSWVPDLLLALGEHMQPHIGDLEAMSKSQVAGVQSQVEWIFEMLDPMPKAQEAP